MHIPSIYTRIPPPLTPRRFALMIPQEHNRGLRWSLCLSCRALHPAALNLFPHHHPLYRSRKEIFSCHDCAMNKRSHHTSGLRQS